MELSTGELPLLTPMSEVAGRMAVQEGAKYLEKPQGGLGVLLGGVPGVKPGKVLILGGGVVGTNAAKMASAPAPRRRIVPPRLVRVSFRSPFGMRPGNGRAEGLRPLFSNSSTAAGAGAGAISPGAWPTSHS